MVLGSAMDGSVAGTVLKVTGIFSSGMVEVKDVSKTYNQGKVLVHALDSVSLCVEMGEFCALVGPSGSGKTTLLNL